MSTVEAAVESIENALLNEAQIYGFDGLSDDKYKKLEKRCVF
jgi:hypothetical protein